MSAGGILFPLAYRREVREAVDFIARANGNNLAIAAYWQALIGRLREELLEFGVDDFDLWQELMTFHMAVRKTFIDLSLIHI